MPLNLRPGWPPKWHNGEAEAENEVEAENKVLRFECHNWHFTVYYTVEDGLATGSIKQGKYDNHVVFFYDEPVASLEEYARKEAEKYYKHWA